MIQLLSVCSAMAVVGGTAGLVFCVICSMEAKEMADIRADSCERIAQQLADFTLDQMASRTEEMMRRAAQAEVEAQRHDASGSRSADGQHQ